MTVQRWAALLAIGCWAFAGLASTAGASCNVIPDAAQTFGATPEGRKIAQTLPSDLSYRGAFGRIDGTTLVPATASSITVGPDDYCLGKSGQRHVLYRPEEPDDLQVMLLYEPADGRPTAAFYASAENCERIVAQFSKFAAVKGRSQMGLIGCAPAREHVEIRKAPEGDSFRLRIAGSTAGVPGAVSLVVLSAAREDIGDFHLGDLLRGDCAGLGADFAGDSGKLFCIDTIYDDYRERCAVGPMNAAVVPANLIAIPPPNEFHEQCFGGAGSNNDLRACDPEDPQKPPTELSFTVDAQGGIHIPFDFTEILEKNGTGPIERMLAGVTATSRKERGKDPKVVLPGREFVGSNPLGDPNGNKTNWRKPEFDVFQPVGRPHETGLIGYADKNDSIVHVYPRLKVGWVCDSPTATGEACLGVEQQASGGVDACAAGDRLGATCSSLLVERFFACEGGPYDGMPCTRPLHCGIEGACTGTPKCQVRSTAWEPNKNTGSGTCQVDADCNGANHQCGFSLFDAEDRNGKLIWELKKAGNPKDRRGACKGDPNNVCRSTGSGNLCSDGSVCAGFHLQAMDER